MRIHNKYVSTTYDQVLYRGLPYAQTHPSRLATMAALFGMEPAPVDRCRVLELGCGDGGNLIPMAFELPGSEFVGLDLAATPIEIGQESARQLGLTNIRLRAADILAAAPELGEFDYIIAHGVYSWVPEAVREELMRIVGAHLAPHGVAYVSYNALPGCHMRLMLREMMLYHLRDVNDPGSRLQQAIKFLEFLMTAPPTKNTVGAMQNEVQGFLDRDPAVLFHDELSEAYFPIHFSDFMAHAARRGLQYLAEAAIYDMEPSKASPEAREQLAIYAGGRRIEREQYMDFLKCRKFRQTLLCRADVQIADAPIADRIRALYASSPATPVSPDPDLTGTAIEEFTAPRKAAMKTAHPLAKSAVGILAKRWPEALHFDELLARCSELSRAAADSGELSEILLATHRAGLVELHARAPACTSVPGERPAASTLARWQARQRHSLTTARHTTIEATGDLELRLLALLDGTRDRRDLATEIGPLLEPPRPAPEVLEELDKNLSKLARFGLLIA